MWWFPRLSSWAVDQPTLKQTGWKWWVTSCILIENISRMPKGKRNWVSFALCPLCLSGRAIYSHDTVVWIFLACVIRFILFVFLSSCVFCRPQVHVKAVMNCRRNCEQDVPLMLRDLISCLLLHQRIQLGGLFADLHENVTTYWHIV